MIISDFLPASCEGEKCNYVVDTNPDIPVYKRKCGEHAWHKVEETIFPDDPYYIRHPYTAYVCREHFMLIMGIFGNG